MNSWLFRRARNLETDNEMYGQRSGRARSFMERILAVCCSSPSLELLQNLPSFRQPRCCSTYAPRPQCPTHQSVRKNASTVARRLSTARSSRGNNFSASVLPSPAALNTQHRVITSELLHVILGTRAVLLSPIPGIGGSPLVDRDDTEPKDSSCLVSSHANEARGYYSEDAVEGAID